MGDGGDGHWLVQMEWRPAGWSVCLPLLIFPCTIKSRSSSGTGSPGWSRKKGSKMCVCVSVYLYYCTRCGACFLLNEVRHFCSILVVSFKLLGCKELAWYIYWCYLSYKDTKCGFYFEDSHLLYHIFFGTFSCYWINEQVVSHLWNLYILKAVRCLYFRTSVMVGVASSVANDIIMRTGLQEWCHNDSRCLWRYGDWRSCLRLHCSIII